MNRLLLLLFGAATFVAHAQVPDYVPTEGLVGWWPLYESLNDLGPNGLNATSNEVEYSCTDLDSFCNLELNEASSDVFLPSGLELNGTDGGVTCAAWLRIDDMGSSDWRIAIDVTDGTSNNAWGDRFVQGVTRSEEAFYWNSGGHFDNDIYVDYGLSTAYPIEEGIWYHFAATWDFEGKLTHYIQGQPIDSIDVSEIGDFILVGGNQGSRKIGARAHNSDPNVKWVGGIRDIGIWQRPLSSQEVAFVFNETAAVLGCTDSTACNYNDEANEDDGSCVYPPIIELGEDLISCDEAVVIEVGNGFSTYLWSTGETTPAIEVSESGMISVEVSIGLEGASEIQEIDGFTYIGELGQSRYYVSEASILWEEAKINCEMLGGHLVTISSPEENELVWQGVYGNGLNPGGTNNYQAWIGLYQNTNSPDYSEPDGGWEWVNGEPLNYLNWAPNQPNNSDQGHFAHMTDANGNCSEGDPVCGVWDDANISWNLQSAFYVLELGPTSAYCSTSDSVYVDLDHGSCFCGLNAYWDSDVEECVGQTPSSDACGPGTYWDDIEMICLPMTTCQDDLDGDGVIGVNDLMQLLSSFGTDCAPAEGPETTEFTCGDPVSYQGYDYATVLISEQCWFAENLRTEHYANGDSIPANLTNSEWSATTSGAVAVYGEDENCANYSPDGDACDPVWSLSEYGRLYNWYAVDDTRGLCPSGWHVPTDGEWMALEMELGMTEPEANGIYMRGTDQGTQLKSTYGWSNGGNGTNCSGYVGLPGGYRVKLGGFAQAGSNGVWWSSSPSGPLAWVRGLTTVSTLVYRGEYDREGGNSVRCLKGSNP